MPVLTYGVVACGEGLRAWQLACVRELEQSGLARLRGVIHRPFDEPSSAYDRFCATLPLPSRSRVDFTELERSTGGLSDERPDALDLDFLLLFGEPRFGAELRTAAKYGVWYFAHSDIARFSSSAPGFWELYNNHDVTGASLLRLGDPDVAGTALRSGYFPTAHDSFATNLENVLTAVQKWPVQVCSEIAQGAASYFEDAPIAQPPLHYGNPSNLQILGLRLLQSKNRLGQHVQNRFYSIDWHIGRLSGSVSDFIDRDGSADIAFLYPNAKGTYLADPCLVQQESRMFVFCEEYWHDDEHGVIVASDVSMASTLRPQIAIEEAHHLSYPQVFEHDGAIFCIPESGDAKTVSLYRSVEFPYKWEYVHTLIDGFPATDPTVVQFEDKWWLFCSSDEFAKRGYNSHLYVWYADDLWGAWTPHARNPVKIDARSVRPAGKLFVHANRLYRPAQDCSRTYGGAIRINRILALTPTDFKETVVGVIRPPEGEYNKGIHTISMAGDWCMVDAKRYVFNPAGITDELRWAIKSAALGLGVPPKAIQSLAKRLRKSAP